MAKYLFICIILTFPPSLFAQEATPAEIKSKKIKKQTIANTYSDGTVSTTVLYYDANGNDTATYRDGARASFKVISYNSRNKIDKIMIYDDTGKEKETSVYTYNKDGSATMVNKDVSFGLAYNYRYDKEGRLLEFRIPDGTVIKYTYNAKGLLIKKQNIPGDKEEKGSVNTYKYNAKNKIVSSSLNGGPSSLFYDYGADGLLKKISNKAGTYKSTYEYGY